MEEYPVVGKNIMKVLPMYQCELGFSYLNNINNREWVQSVEEELRE